MIILLWVRVCRCVGPRHRGPNVHEVASLPPEKSGLRHTGSSPPEKGDFGSGDVDWLGNRRMRATQPTKAQPAHHGRSSTRGSADFWPVSLRSTRSMLRASLAAGWKMEPGNLTIC